MLKRFLARWRKGSGNGQTWCRSFSIASRIAEAGTFKASASRKSIFRLGCFSPVSSLPICDLEISSCAASVSCEKPLAVLSWRNILPKFSSIFQYYRIAFFLAATYRSRRVKPRIQRMVGVAEAIPHRHMGKFLLLFAFCLFLGVPVAYAEQYRVVAVSDGDTITIEPIQGGDRTKVRLHGIDAPELRQPHGQVAKTFVRDAVLYKEVDIHSTPQGTDRYGRVVAVVDVPGTGVLQELLIDAGLAWVWSRYCRDCDEWKSVQANARLLKKGLWKSDHPIEPWEWRKRR